MTTPENVPQTPPPHPVDVPKQNGSMEERAAQYIRKVSAPRPGNVRNMPEYGPLEEATGNAGVMGALLKYPGRVAYEQQQREGMHRTLPYLLLFLAGMALYGLVMGSFSGGAQWFWSPIKVVGGILLSAAICYPSLYIFACLSGVEISAAAVARVFLCSVALISLLLVGLLPVTWVFSTSTESVAFMGFLHLLFWAVSFIFGIRFLLMSFKLIRGASCPHLVLWVLIFTMVTLQMSTTLRPILGSGEKQFTTEKKFFLAHWVETLESSSSSTTTGGSQRHRRSEPLL